MNVEIVKRGDIEVTDVEVSKLCNGIYRVRVKRIGDELIYVSGGYKPERGYYKIILYLEPSENPTKSTEVIISPETEKEIEEFSSPFFPYFEDRKSVHNDIDVIFVRSDILKHPIEQECFVTLKSLL